MWREKSMMYGKKRTSMQSITARTPARLTERFLSDNRATRENGAMNVNEDIFMEASTPAAGIHIIRLQKSIAKTRAYADATKYSNCPTQSSVLPTGERRIQERHTNTVSGISDFALAAHNTQLTAARNTAIFITVCMMYTALYPSGTILLYSQYVTGGEKGTLCPR